MSEVETQVKQIDVDHLGIDDSKVTPESKFIDDLGADSLDTVELVMALDEEFDLEIADLLIQSGACNNKPKVVERIKNINLRKTTPYYFLFKD